MPPSAKMNKVEDVSRGGERRKAKGLRTYRSSLAQQQIDHPLRVKLEQHALEDQLDGVVKQLLAVEILLCKARDVQTRGRVYLIRLSSVPGRCACAGTEGRTYLDKLQTG